MFGFPVEKVQLRLHFFLSRALAGQQHNPNNCSSWSAAGGQGRSKIFFQEMCFFYLTL
jgi:hypothetical protein